MTKSLVLLSLFAASSFAATIQDGHVDLKRNAIVLNVTYGGGCKEHNFTLDMGMCYETFPVQCEAKLVDNTKGDFCEAIVGREVVLPLADYNLTESYYSRGSLTIKGSDNSQVTVRLP